MIVKSISIINGIQVASYEEFADVEQQEPIIDIESVRGRKLAEIADADKESESFSVNGTSMWLDKATRTSLIANTIPALEKVGDTSTTLWANGVGYEMPIEALKSMLVQLECYAKDTYDIMQQHIAEVNAITEVSELEAYNAREGYPSKLEFKI